MKKKKKILPLETQPWIKPPKLKLAKKKKTQFAKKKSDLQKAINTDFPKKKKKIQICKDTGRDL